jgi:hypothetical protein
MSVFLAEVQAYKSNNIAHPASMPVLKKYLIAVL